MAASTVAASRGQMPNSKARQVAMLPTPVRQAQPMGEGHHCSHGCMTRLPAATASAMTSAPIMGSATTSSQRAARMPSGPTAKPRRPVPPMPECLANRHHAPVVMMAISPKLPQLPMSCGASSTAGISSSTSHSAMYGNSMRHVGVSVRFSNRPMPSASSMRAQT
jgi:hypothetical protein